MNSFLIFYLIGVTLAIIFWFCMLYEDYEYDIPITVGYLCAAICAALTSWFSIIVVIAFSLCKCSTNIVFEKNYDYDD